MILITSIEYITQLLAKSLKVYVNVFLFISLYT